jgi:hypothetical protein
MLNKFILFFLILIPINAKADSIDTCIQNCLSDVISVESCTKEEKNYWDTQKNFNNYVKSCEQLIKNEREYCVQDCYRYFKDDFGIFED